MNKQQTNSDKKILAFLEAEYNKVRRKTDCIRLHVTDLNFEENVPDPQERYLMMDQLNVFEQVQANIMNRIRFYRSRVKLEEHKEKIAEHLEHEQREFMPVLEKMNKTFQLPAFTNIAQEKFEAFQKGEISLQEFLESVPCNESFLKAVVLYLTDEQHHCGQDACCQVDDGNAVVDKPIITGESLEQLVGATVRLFHKPGHKCIDCPYSSKSYGGKCEYKKVELGGGYYLCLADLPNSIVTE